MQVYPLRNIDFTLNFLNFNTTEPKLKTMNKSHAWIRLGAAHPQKLCAIWGH